MAQNCAASTIVRTCDIQTPMISDPGSRQACLQEDFKNANDASTRRLASKNLHSLLDSNVDVFHRWGMVTQTRTETEACCV
eukprot:51979-Eustigmatos_ZCMA.PRE.1